MTRISLFSSSQSGTLDDYIPCEFSRLSLKVPKLDEHSRAVLFVMGLSAAIKDDVLREHPESLELAIAAAKTVEQTRRLFRGRHIGRQGDPANHGVVQRSNQENGGRLRGEIRCFKCRELGHVARDCKHPNAGRQ